MQTRGSRRGLSTARAALQVAWLLAARPEGVRADHVAETLGKSVSTAYNLLASLCEEGVATHEPGGVYRLSPAFRDTVTTGAIAPAPELHDLAGLVADLLARTHKRSYLAVVRHGELNVVLERGLQGMPKLPGLKPRVGDTAHAVALGKVVLALSAPEVLERYVRKPGLRRFTAHTITDPRRACGRSWARRGAGGYAVEREEFDDDFCCIAAPVRDAPRALPRGDRDLDVPPRVRRGARDPREDRPRRRRRGRRGTPAARPDGRRSARERGAAPRLRAPRAALSSHLPKRRSFLIRAVPRA